MHISASIAEKRLQELGIKDMPLFEYTPKLTAVAPDWFLKYKKLCKEFMMSLTDSVETLAIQGMPQDEFMNLIMGKKLPQNFSIRLRVPLVWGGKLEIDNMFLCKTFPRSYNIDRFIIGQSGNDTIWLPNPATKVYIPISILSGGPGGNGTEDRITETSAAQIVADRDI